MAGGAFAGMPRVFTRTLGDSVRIDYIPATGDRVDDIDGVYTSAYQAALAAQIPVESSAPMISLAASECPNRSHDDRFERDGVTYKPVEIQPDSFGMVVFILHEVSE